MKNNIVEWTHDILKESIQPGDICIDATAGRGNDTLFLRRLVGERGSVYAFDIQKEALESTRQLLQNHSCSSSCKLILDSHEHMDQCVKKETVSAIVFNFGYLPGGDHSLQTKPDTSIAAILSGLSLLKKGGVMSLCIYNGKDSGFEERDALLAFLKDLNYRTYLVMVTSYYNRPNHPPIPVFIKKL